MNIHLGLHRLRLRKKNIIKGRVTRNIFCGTNVIIKFKAALPTNKAPLLSCLAPSEVLAIRQENASQNSVTLLWHEPDQPNGVILEYDIKYHEKVTDNIQS